MSPQKKQAISEHRRKFESLPADEKTKIMERYQWFQSLSPEQKEEVRKQWKQDRKK